MNPSEQITQKIASLTDWRGPLLARLREIALSDPEMVEEWKWNVPVWSRGGMVCSVGAFKDHLKFNFFQGAALTDPDGLFNAGLDAKATRAIDFREGDSIDEAKLKRLVNAAVAHNLSKK
ncbi:MAG: DUF1801 domain-containing protein [Thermaceae bacterium]|nr:DUF1801 domain-containing protein [Thermaceae bacterium]